MSIRPVAEMVAEANSQVAHMPAADALSLHGQPGITFVDLRDPRELSRDGMIPDAFHATRGMLEFWIDPASPYAKEAFQTGNRFVFYCASGWRSALAAKAAQDMGLENVSHIEDGFAGWKKAGGPIAQR
ncbi:rhodanese-like domain-containing protein [Pontivivens nitratireducens]|uniref:Rhodanese-like domain-containing protein n=1 Tax=Pontivivens nitratireducens TaxID=2758038 RepID=A0A6G7VIY5_9RHOB|nr:rhodanese-like domain-containing protein [Pontibrevibacter nitratireducens]QIK39902.1 rhodanese-like domain-containing protein [Pontibrevibacter nitratireducens]